MITVIKLLLFTGVCIWCGYSIVTLIKLIVARSRARKDKKNNVPPDHSA